MMEKEFLFFFIKIRISEEIFELYKTKKFLKVNFNKINIKVKINSKLNENKRKKLFKAY